MEGEGQMYRKERKEEGKEAVHSSLTSVTVPSLEAGGTEALPGLVVARVLSTLTLTLAVQTILFCGDEKGM